MLCKQKILIQHLLLVTLTIGCFTAKAQVKNMPPEQEADSSGPLYIGALPAPDGEANALEQQIGTLLKKINQSGLTDKDNTDSSLAVWNDQLLLALEHGVAVFPDFLQRDFPQWKENGLHILTSADRKFRIVCWNNQQSGTNQEWTAVVFWQGKNELYAAEMGDPQYDALRPSYSSITAIKLKDRSSCYLVQARGHMDNRYKYDYIKVYRITAIGALETGAKLFEAGAKRMNCIGYAVDMASIPGRAGHEYPLIHLSGDKKKLYIPIVMEDGMLEKGRYLTYHFSGTQFVYR